MKVGLVMPHAQGVRKVVAVVAAAVEAPKVVLVRVQWVGSE